MTGEFLEQCVWTYKIISPKLSNRESNKESFCVFISAGGPETQVNFHSKLGPPLHPATVTFYAICNKEDAIYLFYNA